MNIAIVIFVIVLVNVFAYAMCELSRRDYVQDAVKFIVICKTETQEGCSINYAESSAL